MFGNQVPRRPFGGPAPRPERFSPDMPQEIRAKAIEAAKLRIDLEDVLSQKPLDRTKAVELNGKIASLEQEVRTWRFEQKLDRIEKGPVGQPGQTPESPEAQPEE